MPYQIRLDSYGIHNVKVLRNLSAAELYEHAVRHDGAKIAANGALNVLSGEKKGRSPSDKRVVEETTSRDDIWWGDVNRPVSTSAFRRNRARAVDYLNGCDRVYVVDAFAGWSPKERIKVRVICSRPYHALFMTNMLIRPSAQEASEFGTPDYVIFNAGAQPADPSIEGVDSTTSVALNFALGEFVILGTEYAGEMKKGVFTIMNYLLPKRDVLSMHCSANEGQRGDVSLFFGLSGTGKTTLSADPHRDLIGDDEHGWGVDGVFNIEGGCYAKCIDLSAESEPAIYNAIRFGTVLENTVLDPASRVVDFSDSSLTENTRASYPIEFIPNAQVPCRGRHPRNIIFLTCDAFGVLPPVSVLSPEQAMYHFISGYTAKVAGTEVGVTEPKPNFSACFGAPFLVWHPTKYAELLAAKMREHDVRAYLVNTGWSGGAYGVGSRISLSYTRAIIDAIHDGALIDAETVTDPVFGLATPRTCADVPSEMLQPRDAWADGAEYDAAAARLAERFVENFRLYEDVASPEVLAAGPTVAAATS